MQIWPSNNFVLHSQHYPLLKFYSIPFKDIFPCCVIIKNHGCIANGYQTWVCTHLSIGVETFVELEVLGTFGGQGSREPHAPYSYWVENFTKSPPFNAIARDNKHSPFERNMHNPFSELLKHSPFERSMHNSLPMQ